MVQDIALVVQQAGQGVSRKSIIRVVLSPQHKEILDVICRKLGQSESETLRVAFLQYAEKLGLTTEKVHGKIQK
jgi:hypothetical protein